MFDWGFFQPAAKPIEADDQRNVAVTDRPGVATVQNADMIAQQATAVHSADLANYSANPAPAPAALDTPAELAKDPDTAANQMHAARIEQLAQAINRAENGGDPNGGHRCNPGNLTGDDETVCHFDTPATGWARLRARLYLDFIEGRSKIYSASMSFRELAWMWVAGGAPGRVRPHSGDNPENWASIVAGTLGVSVTSAVGDFLNGAQT